MGERIAIVTVHGTGDTAPEPEGPPDGDHWFLKRSKFIARLHQRLTGHGLEADVIPFLWSGANSAIARDKGARKLAEQINKLSKSYDGRVHVIGHSHGGNVANDAALRLNWSGAQRTPKLASMTTVGTPFFRSRVTTGERVGAWIFLFVVLASIVLIPLITWIAGDAVTAAIADLFGMPGKDVEFDEARLAFEATASQPSALRPLLNWLGANALMVASGIALLFIIPVAFRGINRISRAARRARAETKVFTIWHDNDEAISFLSRVEHLPLEPFPRGSLFAGSRTGGVTWGVRALVLINLIGAVVLAYDALVRHVDIAANPYSSFGVYLLILGIAGAPLVFAATYVFYRLIVALLLEVRCATLNNSPAVRCGRSPWAAMAIIASATLGPRSHYYGSEDMLLGGEVAQRMVTNSAAASQRLFDKYRSAVRSASPTRATP
ncbi:MAG: hypothetical protein R3C16_03595 [Hyphomonadaceae bacterium]